MDIYTNTRFIIDTYINTPVKPRDACACTLAYPRTRHGYAYSPTKMHAIPANTPPVPTELSLLGSLISKG